MTIGQPIDASLTAPPLSWKAIDWPQIRQAVRRLQMRIAKATQAGHHRKAQALQWLLTHSRAAKLLAVHRVTTNRGAKTPGVDNAIWRTDKQKLQAAFNLKRHGYRPRPLRRHYLPKPNGKLRPLSIPTLHDRAMQALYALALAPIVETLADPNSYGFREGRRCADALVHCHNLLSHSVSAQWVLEGDIRACFDEISHEWLLTHVPMDRRMLRAWLEAGYWEKGKLFPTRNGTPQGGLISPLLANCALDGMEQAVHAAAARGDKVNFVRYADDFVVTGATRELLEQKVKPALTAFLQPRGLRLSEQKTVITHLQEGFDFLGHTLRKFGHKLLIFPAQSKVQSLRQKLKQLIQSALGLSQEQLLRQLNPRLRGWANYYRNGAAQRTFKKLDDYVYHRLWNWATRRHPTKSSAWKRQKYFCATGQPGAFGVPVRRATGELRGLALYLLASTRIERHIKVRGAANPYDPTYTQYFARRRCFAWRVP
jgi:RNA-directed DNA polymerase